MLTSMAEKNAYREAIKAFANPLRYASRDGFRNLDRVRDLDAPLKRAVERAIRAGPDANALRLLGEISKLIPADDAPRPLRVDRFGECLERLVMLEGLPAAAPEAPKPAKTRQPPPPRTSRSLTSRSLPSSGVKPLALSDLKSSEPAGPEPVERGGRGVLRRGGRVGGAATDSGRFAVVARTR